jgi:hypothetical protein
MENQTDALRIALLKKDLERDLLQTIQKKLCTFHEATGLNVEQICVVMTDISDVSNHEQYVADVTVTLSPNIQI